MKLLMLTILLFVSVSCKDGGSETAPPYLSEAQMRDLRGKKISDVIAQCGDPMKVQSGEFYGTKFQEGRIAVVFTYIFGHEYKVYLREDGYVLAAKPKKGALRP